MASKLESREEDHGRALISYIRAMISKTSGQDKPHKSWVVIIVSVARLSQIASLKRLMIEMRGFYIKFKKLEVERSWGSPAYFLFFIHVDVNSFLPFIVAYDRLLKVISGLDELKLCND